MFKKVGTLGLAVALLTGCSLTSVPNTPESLCGALDTVAAQTIKKALAGDDYSAEFKQLNLIADSYDEKTLTDNKLKFGLAAIVVVTNPAFSDTFSLNQIGEGLAHMRVACKSAGFPWVESEKYN